MKAPRKSAAVSAALAMSVLVVTSILISPSAQAVPPFSEWADAMNLGPTVNSAFADANPAISKDGLSLFFASNRPGTEGGGDIFVSQRPSTDDPWGPPVNLGPPVNTESFDGVPALSRDDHWLFFNSNRPGGFGDIDLWASYREHIHDDFDWQSPVNIGPNINSPFFDGGASYFENDDVGVPLLFFVSNRPGGLGGFDIYFSAQQTDGSFGPPEPVVELNSMQNDNRPAIRFDGLEIFLFSNRPGSLGGNDIWVSTREAVSEPWGTPVNLGPAVNSQQDEIQAYVTADRKSLFFASNRPGGEGLFDLYVTTRTLVMA